MRMCTPCAPHVHDMFSLICRGCLAQEGTRGHKRACFAYLQMHICRPGRDRGSDCHEWENERPQTEQAYFNCISLGLTAVSLVALRLTALSLAALSLAALSLTPPMLSTRLALRLLGLLQKCKVQRRLPWHLPPADASHSMSAVCPMLKHSLWLTRNASHLPTDMS